SGLFWEEWRAAPLSRVQTVDKTRGPLQRLFGLATGVVTTASSKGADRITALDADAAEELVDRRALLAEGDRREAPCAGRQTRPGHPPPPPGPPPILLRDRGARPLVPPVRPTIPPRTGGVWTRAPSPRPPSSPRAPWSSPRSPSGSACCSAASASAGCCCGRSAGCSWAPRRPR